MFCKHLLLVFFCCLFLNLLCLLMYKPIVLMDSRQLHLQIVQTFKVNMFKIKWVPIPTHFSSFVSQWYHLLLNYSNQQELRVCFSYPLPSIPGLLHRVCKFSALLDNIQLFYKVLVLVNISTNILPAHLLLQICLQKILSNSYRLKCVSSSSIPSKDESPE